jgi:hypothetical protein
VYHARQGRYPRFVCLDLSKDRRHKEGQIFARTRCERRKQVPSARARRQWRPHPLSPPGRQAPAKAPSSKAQGHAKERTQCSCKWFLPAVALRTPYRILELHAVLQALHCSRGLMRLRMGPKHGLGPHRHAPITCTRPFKWSTFTQVGHAPVPQRSQGPASRAHGTRMYTKLRAALSAALTRVGPAAAVARNTAMLCSRAGRGRKRGPWLFRRCGKCKAKNVSALGDDSHDAEQTTLMPGCT